MASPETSFVDGKGRDIGEIDSQQHLLVASSDRRLSSSEQHDRPDIAPWIDSDERVRQARRQLYTVCF
jgi:hypothetical protein